MTVTRRYGSSLWVLAFLGFALALFLPAMRSRHLAVAELRSRLAVMEMDKQSAMAHREELLLRIASQSDPAWVELVLLKELGMVPEGFLKVHFKK